MAQRHCSKKLAKLNVIQYMSRASTLWPISSRVHFSVILLQIKDMYATQGEARTDRSGCPAPVVEFS